MPIFFDKKIKQLQSRHILKGISELRSCYSYNMEISELRSAQIFVSDSSCHFPFKQLFVIRRYRNSSYTYLFFSLLSSKCHDTHKIMLDRLKNHSCDYIPSRVFCDFERAIHTAVKDVCPTTTLKGCRFHLGQA